MSRAVSDKAGQATCSTKACHCLHHAHGKTATCMYESCTPVPACPLRLSPSAPSKPISAVPLQSSMSTCDGWVVPACCSAAMPQRAKAACSPVHSNSHPTMLLLLPFAFGRA